MISFVPFVSLLPFFIIFFVSRVFGVRIHSPAVAPRCRAPNLLPSFYWLLCCFFVLFAFVLFSKWSLISEDGDRDAVGSRFRFYFSFLYFVVVWFVSSFFCLCFVGGRSRWPISVDDVTNGARRCRRGFHRRVDAGAIDDRRACRSGPIAIAFGPNLHAICMPFA